MGQKKKDIIYTWDDFLKRVERVSMILKKRWFLHKLSIVVIREGGVAFGILLASKLNMSLHFIKAKSYKNRKKSEVKVGRIPVGLVKGSQIILVDDIRETGGTLKKVKEKLFKKGIYIVDEVVLVEKRPSQGWYIFPWENK